MEVTIHKGGPGSGHKGHVGRPGKVGGSLSGSSSTTTAKREPRRYASDRANYEDLSRESEAWIDELSMDETHALYAYTSSGYRYVNSYLRGTQYEEVGGRSIDVGEEEIVKITEDIEAALDRASLAEDTIVYRGTKSSNMVYDIQSGKIKVGDVIYDRGFMSTSVDVEDARVFSGSVHGVLFTIIAPKGSKGAYLSLLSAADEENEFLFQAGSRLKITKIRKTPGSQAFYMVDAELRQ